MTAGKGGVEAGQTLGLQAGKPYYERGRGRADSRVTGWEALL